MHMGNENICPHKTHTSMFISALFITAKKWKLSKCPSADKGIKGGPSRQWSLPQPYKALTQATTRTNLENMVLRERSPTQRPRRVTPLI